MVTACGKYSCVVIIALSFRKARAWMCTAAVGGSHRAGWAGNAGGFGTGSQDGEEREDGHLGTGVFCLMRHMFVLECPELIRSMKDDLV